MSLSLIAEINQEMKYIESVLDTVEELEIDSGDGKLTIETPNGSKFILSRQSATNQIWLAEPTNGWRFDYTQANGTAIWISEKGGHALRPFLATLLSETSGLTISL